MTNVLRPVHCLPGATDSHSTALHSPDNSQWKRNETVRTKKMISKDHKRFSRHSANRNSILEDQQLQKEELGRVKVA